MDTAPHVLFAGGGSLGYLYPGLAIAERLRSHLPGLRVSFAGDGRPIERHMIRSAGYAYTAIPCRHRPRSLWGAVRYVTDNAAGFFVAPWLLKEQQVSLVVGLGGHASAPILRAAHAWGIPTVLVEQNASPALSTKWHAKRAASVCLGFEQAEQSLPATTNTLFTGTPGRPSVEQLANQPVLPATQSPSRQRRLVVLGGAGGARSINESMPLAAAQLQESLDGWQIVHQCGERQLTETTCRYREAGVDALVVTYIDELADLLRETDLVVCRPSGCTLAEMALAAKPAIVVPDQRAVHGSQIVNAQLWRESGACRIVSETRAPSLAEGLAKELDFLLQRPEQLRAISRAARGRARPEAAEMIANACLSALGVALPSTTAPQEALKRAA